jgi:DNA-binding response OmpR family regulator
MEKMNRKILIIDDDEAILDALSLLLTDSGYEVITVQKGSIAFQQVNAHMPDVILLDVLMSGSDGRELCQQLKQKSHTKHIPLIMISAHPSAQREVLACGADDFLAKPFEFEDLLAKLEKHLKAKT